jgi:hypothetical protein
MLLNLLKRKRRITSEHFAQMLWEFSCLGSISLYDLLRPRLLEGGYRLSKDEDARFFREVVIANLWTIYRSLRADKSTLRSLHQIAASGGQNLPGCEGKETSSIRFTQDELCERYAMYDAVCGENSGGPLMLSVCMLECMLPGRRASLNAMLGFLIAAHVASGIKAILKLRRGYNVSD